MNERRRHRRLPVTLSIHFVDPSSASRMQQTNLSESGLFIHTDEPVPEGQTIAVVLSHTSCREPIHLRARVVRVARSGDADGPGMAVEFVEVPPRETARLRAIIAAQAERGVVAVLGCEASERHALASLLAASGLQVLEVDGKSATAETLHEATVRAAIVDTSGPQDSWPDTISELRSHDPGLRVVVLTEQPSSALIAYAGRFAAFDLVRKPIAVTELLARVRNALAESVPAQSTAGKLLPRLVTMSTAMQQLWEETCKVAGLDYTVLIEGETGAGKRVVAEWLHLLGPHSSGPFVTADCAALNPQLIESELFGHVRGAFTGAVDTQVGRIERAQNGTLLLDEVGTLDQATQIKLLRVLEEKKFERVGGSQTLQSNARIIAATNESLEALVSSGRFRKDLFYRLAFFRLVVPPLRERGADLLPLAYQLLEELCREHGRSLPSIEEPALVQMQGYAWPGNVRELRNVLAQGLVALGSGDKLVHLAFPSRPRAEAERAGQAGEFWNEPSPKARAGFFEKPFRVRMREYSDYWLGQAMTQANGSIAEAARLCQMARSSVHQRLKSAERAPKPRLLLIDDDTRQLAAQVRLFKSEYDVTTAEGGTQALAVLSNAPKFDLVLCDVVMPEMSGVDLFERLCQDQPDAAAHFVLCTGDPRAQELVERTAHTPPLVYKPVRPEKIREITPPADRRRPPGRPSARGE